MRSWIILLLAAFFVFAMATMADAEVAGKGEPAPYLEGPCSVSWTCPAGACQAEVSCTGNQSCEAAPDYVICDGNRTDCVMPDMDCVMACRVEFFNCMVNCIPMPDPPPDPCGCAAARDLCMEACCW